MTENDFDISNFLLGNIDVRGDLEDNLFDEDIKQHLSTLKHLNIFNNVDINIKDEENQSKIVTEIENVDSNVSYNSPIDYSNISDTTSDQEDVDRHISTLDIVEDSNIDQAKLLNNEKYLNNIKMPLRDQLAPLIPSELANLDVNEIFPHFKFNDILRFNKLFGPGKPSSLPKIWRNFSKRRRKIYQLYKLTANKNGNNIPINKEFDRQAQLILELPTTDETVAQNETAEIKQPYELQIETDDEEEMMKDTPMQSDHHFRGHPTLYKPVMDDDENKNKLGSSGKESISSGSSSELESEGYEYYSEEDGYENDPLTLTPWEDQVIINGGSALLTAEAGPDHVISAQQAKIAAGVTDETERFVGWLPAATIRSYSAAVGQKTPVAKEQKNEANFVPLLSQEYSELACTNWEDDIIWNADDLKDDPDIVSNWPESVYQSQPILQPQTCPFSPESLEKRLNLTSNDYHYFHNLFRSSHNAASNSAQSSKSQSFPFNLPGIGGNQNFTPINNSNFNEDMLLFSALQLQHSTPASELWPAFYPTHMGPLRLKHFHRPLLKKYSHGALAITHAQQQNSQGGVRQFFPVASVEERVERLKKQRENERIASGGGDMFFMHTPQDLSAMDGELVLAEYSEEFPPLMMNIGMATLVKNYHKRRPGKEANIQEFEHGTMAYTHTSPFLGSLAPGQRLQALENNMFRAPIYLHSFPSTHFLVIRTRNGYFLRQIKDIFTVGQECPLIEVPCPNSKKANQFLRDFLHVFLMRLFRASPEKPPRIYMEQVKRAFPALPESALRKKLKSFADFDSNPANQRDIVGPSSEHHHPIHSRFQKRFRVWTLKKDFRLAPEEELRELVRPERACTWYSGLAGEARLIEYGYPPALISGLSAVSGTGVTGSTSKSGQDGAGGGNGSEEEEEEIKAAPWNTTKAFLSAVRGKGLLDLHGAADPTGCGQGFSYVKISNKPRDELSLTFNASGQNASSSSTTTQIGTSGPQSGPSGSKKSVTGTDADLRKLSLKNAKQLLRNFDVPEEELKKLSRWEIIDVVRTLSTQQALLGDDTVTKFARGSKFSATEHQEKFKEECQRIFDLQNRVLSSNEILSSDDGSSTEDSDFEEMGKNIENMLANHKSKKLQSSTSNGDRFDSSRKDSAKIKKEKDARKEAKKNKHLHHIADRKLRITRTFRNPEGKEFIRIETVRNPGVIEAYLRIRESKDPELLAYFSRPDESKKQEMLKEKRRIVDQLKRLRAKEERQRQRMMLDNDNNANDQNTILEGFTKGKDKGGKKYYVKGQRSLLGKKSYLGSKGDMKFRKSFEGDSTDYNKTLERKVKVESGQAETDAGGDKNPMGEDGSGDSSQRVKCGACGSTGHMKTNRLCPLYEKSGKASIPVAMTWEEQESFEKKFPAGDEVRDLVNVEGTKIILSKTIIEHYDNVRKKSLILKFPKKRPFTPPHLDADKKLAKKLKREKMSHDKRSGTIGKKSTPTDGSHIKKYNKSVAHHLAASAKYRREKKLMTSGKSSSGKKYHHHNIGHTRGRPPLSHSGKFIHRKNKMLAHAQHSRVSMSGAGDLASGSKTHGIEDSNPHPQLEDYLKKPHQTNKRRPTDPVVTLSSLLERVLNEMRELPDTQPFIHPVNVKVVPDYYQFVEKPMDLQTMRAKLHKRKYRSREDFLADTTQIVENSRIYNGLNHPITRTAENMLELCVTRLAEKDERFMKLERCINPLLDEDDQVAISFIFETVVKQKLLSVVEFWPFHNPVNPKVLKDYHSKVSRPVDLNTIAKRAKMHAYRTKEDFLADVKLIAANSAIYNGPDSPYTELAHKIYSVCQEALIGYENNINELEKAMTLSERHSIDESVDFPGTSKNANLMGERSSDFYKDGDESADASMNPEYFDSNQDSSSLTFQSTAFQTNPLSLLDSLNSDSQNMASQDKEPMDEEGDFYEAEYVSEKIGEDDMTMTMPSRTVTDLEDDLEITPDNSSISEFENDSDENNQNSFF
ncbi:unnamed protein product [Gordionus sp. m RMFG-2023]|uniref:transcription initiation factor TFIID subunit 1-like n=1 Tax=Gordionus sp. m RMFG-2023 TaxID=3053472 RepID=UPI0030E5ECB9